jgi:hypothetical protein
MQQTPAPPATLEAILEQITYANDEAGGRLASGCQFNGMHPVGDEVLRALVLPGHYKVSEQPLCGQVSWAYLRSSIAQRYQNSSLCFDHQFGPRSRVTP